MRNFDNPHFERDYLQMVSDTIYYGNRKGDRTGTGTHSKFANVLRLDIRDKVAPLLFSKQIHYRSFIIETLWFLSGSTNIRFLKDNNVGIWDEWVIPETAEFEELTPNNRAQTLSKADVSLDYGINHEFTHEEIDSIALHFGLALEGKFRAITDKDLFNYVRCKMQPIYNVWQTLLRSKKVENTSKDFRLFITAGKFWDQIPDVKLVAGDIGVGAYGSLWRNWEDTRIIDKSQEQAYYNRGYQFVADIPRAANWQKGTVGAPEDHVVVHRNIDQIKEAIKLLKTNPDSRRIIVTAWNPGRIEDAALPPCHNMFSLYTADRSDKDIESDIFKNSADFLEWTAIYYKFIEDGIGEEPRYNTGYTHPEISAKLREFATAKGYPVKKLSCLLNMRSNDTALGTPFNVPQYVLLTNMIAQVCNMVTDEFVLVGVDSHVYDNHVEMAKEQISSHYDFTKVTRFVLNPAIKDIDDFKIEDIKVEGYEGYNPPIRYPVAV